MTAKELRAVLGRCAEDTEVVRGTHATPTGESHVPMSPDERPCEVRGGDGRVTVSF